MKSKNVFLSIDTTGSTIDIALSSGEKIFNIQRDIRLTHYEGVVGLIESIMVQSLFADGQGLSDHAFCILQYAAELPIKVPRN